MRFGLSPLDRNAAGQKQPHFLRMHFELVQSALYTLYSFKYFIL